MDYKILSQSRFLIPSFQGHKDDVDIFSSNAFTSTSPVSSSLLIGNKARITAPPTVSQSPEVESVSELGQGYAIYSFYHSNTMRICRHN